MTPDRSADPRRLPRPLAILLTLAILVGPALRSTPSLAAAAPITDHRSPSAIDLAAMALTPDDLAADDLYGYGIAGGGTLSPEAVAASLAFEQDLQESETRDLVTDTSLLQAYELRLDLPTADGTLAQSVRTTIQEYADEHGAIAAFPIVTGWVGVMTAIQVSSDASIGDESTMTRLIGTTLSPHHGLDLTFRSGRMIGSVRLVDFVGGIPAVANVTRFASIVLARILTQSDDSAAGPAPQTLRLDGDGVIPLWDHYTVANQRILQIAGQPILTESEQTAVAEAGIVAEYQVSQRFVTGGLAEQDTYLSGFVLRFADEEIAAAYLRDTPTRIAGSDPSSNYEEISGLREYGEEFIAYEQTAHWADNDVDLNYETYLLRVGPQVAQVQLIGTEWVPYGALEDLAAAQADCLENGFCAEPTSLPAALTAMVQDAAEDSAQLLPYTGTVPSQPRTYVGPIFGVELTYDAATWTAGADEPDAAADRLTLFQLDTSTTLNLSVYPSTDDATVCIGDLTAGFADDEAYGSVKQVTDADGIPVAASTTDLAYAAYGVTLDDATRSFYYVECRTFADGDLALVITHTGPLDHYPARAAAREDLLAGLVLPEE